MRADIHDGPEHKRSKQRPDTLMQDRVCRIDENLLHRTAGPYIGSKAEVSDCPAPRPFYPGTLKADLAGSSTQVGFGPLSDSCIAAKANSTRQPRRRLPATWEAR